jgi:hypothetical protein
MLRARRPLSRRPASSATRCEEDAQPRARPCFGAERVDVERRLAHDRLREGFAQRRGGRVERCVVLACHVVVALPRWERSVVAGSRAKLAALCLFEKRS